MWTWTIGLLLPLVACVETELSGVEGVEAVPSAPGVSAPRDLEDAGSNRAPRDGTTWWEEGDPDVPPGRQPLDEDIDDEVAATFFDEPTIHDFDLSLGGSRGKLATEPKAWVRATFSEDGHSWPVMVRLKGTNSFRPIGQKAAFLVNFVMEDATARFHGLKRLTLDNMMQDSSMLHAHAAYWLFREGGVPAPRHTYARLRVDGSYLGLYGVTETPDEQFLARALPHDRHGNLYEGNVADFRSDKTKRFEIEETDGMYEPYLDIDKAIARIEASTPDTYLATLESLFDIDEFMRFVAIDLAMTNPDGYSMYANNYMAYHGEDHWYLLPWSPDQGFEWYREVDDFEKIEGELVVRCQASPACLERLHTELLTLADDWQSGGLYDVVTEATARIQADCLRDPGADLPCDTEHVSRFVLTRPDTIRDELR